MQRDTSLLNALRGFAALWVVVGHCSIWGGFNVAPLPPPRQAVDLFMVLSGFLMMYTSETKHADGWAAFYVRRFFRIAPAYYLSLLVLAILLQPHTQGYATFMALNPQRWADSFDRTVVLDLPNVLLHVSFLFGLFPFYSASTALPDWSLSLEMQFYAVFPLLFLLTRRNVWAVGALGFLCLVLTTGYAWGTAHLGFHEYRHPALLIFRLPMFLVGMLIYQAGRDRRGRVLCLLLAASLVAVVYRGEGHRTLFTVALFASVAAMWLMKPWDWFVRLTRWPLVTFASDCSYAVYLFHGFFLTIVGSRLLSYLLKAGWYRGAAVLVLTLVVIALTYPVAYAIYNWVERPGIRLGSHLVRRMRTAAPARPASAG